MSALCNHEAILTLMEINEMLMATFESQQVPTTLSYTHQSRGKFCNHTFSSVLSVFCLR